MVTLRLAVAITLLLAAPASAGTVSGKLAPGTAKLPKSAKAGQAQVLALKIDTLAYGAASPVARGGRYALSLPAGKWALRTSIATLGKPFAAFTSAAIVTKDNQRRSLPLTAKRFKKPRRQKRRGAHTANINPRDGQAYPGEAFGIEAFAPASANSAFLGMANGVPDMLTGDLLTNPGCSYTIVEWRKRSVVLAELKLQQSEYVDPASKVEPGHVIDPEILIRGRIEDRPGTPKRLALVAWLVDAKTDARLSGDVSSVSLPTDFFASAERLGQLVMRDLICARTKVAAPAPGPAPLVPPPPPPPPPPSPPVPVAVSNTYTGTFSGESTAVGGAIRQTWSGTVRLDAAQDQGPSAPPPVGAPTGSYRTYTVTSGSVDITVALRPPSGCSLDGSGHFDLIPGFLGQVIVQLDVANPAYVVAISGTGVELIQLVRSGGPECVGTSPFAAIIPWASTGSLAHTSASYALAGTETVTGPYTSTYRWTLSPS